MKRARSKLKRSAQDRRNTALVVRKVPFVEHISELRKRLFRIAASVAVFSTGAYFVQQHIVKALLDPAKGQHFAQTTPGGGIDFLFRVCIYTGVAFSVPIIFQQILGYVSPLIKKDATRFIARVSIASWILALAGIAFGYFVGLHAAMHFLLHQFNNPQVETLISLQSYLSFVLMYLLGAAMLFQVPLVMLVANHIKPLNPKKLFGYERWVVVGCFILGGLLSPSPNISDQLLLAGPMIATYQLGIGMVWFVNRRSRRPKKVGNLRAQDESLRQERIEQFKAARRALTAKQRAAAPATFAAAVPAKVASPAVRVVPAKVSNQPRQRPQPRPVQPIAPSPVPTPALVPAPAPTPLKGAAKPSRPAPNRQYLQAFERRSYFTPAAGRIQL